MMIDVSDQAGFGLWLDQETLDVQTDGTLAFTRKARKGETLQNVLRSSHAITPDCDAYYTYYPENGSAEARQVLNRHELTYSLVSMPPLSIEEEFVKTQGHYHPPMPGKSYGYGYPEVYTQLYGRLLLFLQKRDPSNSDTPLDCVLIDMTPDVSVTIPPEYAHVLINPTREIGLMAGLYSPNFKPDYSEVYAHRGLAYYVLGRGGDIVIEPNPHYTNAPPLNQIDNLTDTIFEPPHPGVPVWKAFTTNPETYAFLTQPEALDRFFEPRSGRRGV